MTYKVTFDQKAGYLHVVATGTNTKANVMRYLADILHECEACDCFRVLIEERLEGPRMGTMDIFDIASQGRSRDAVRLPIVAYVDVNATNPSDMKFAEDVAVNRGTFVRVFSSVADAELWITNLDSKFSRPKDEYP
jgi:hypothetical protein